MAVTYEGGGCFPGHSMSDLPYTAACDEGDCLAKLGPIRESAFFTAARRQGWELNATGSHALCPEHANQNEPLQEDA